jgi:hexosaminidase
MRLDLCKFFPVFFLWHSALAIWPIPRTLQTGSGLLKLSPNFRIEVNGIPHPPQDLLDAVSRTNTRLQSDKLQRLVVGRGSSDQAKLVNALSLAKLTLSLTSPTAGPVQSIMEEATKAINSRSESYSLIVPNSNSGVAAIVSNSTLGLFRGLTTFEQLWYDDSSGTTYTYQAPVTISNDSPAYVSVEIIHCLSASEHI